MVVFSAVSGILGTHAWFASRAEINTGYVNGASLGAYFAYGDGTKDNPYGISELRHLYNLAWLQYLDYFKRDNEDEAFDGLYYFELAADITGGQDNIYHLPPIGTDDHPFIGQFDGQGYTISGITFTNYDEFEKVPYLVSQEGFDPMDDVGMFGVVDSLSQNTSNGTNTYIGNFGLSNITVEAKTTAANLGVVVADLDANVENVAVDNPTVSIIGNSTSSSDYSLVGKCTASCKRQIKKVDESLYDLNIHKSEFVAQTGNQEGWGGSIDMKEVHARLNHIRKNYAVSGVTRSGNTYYFKQPTHHTTTYEPDGVTVLNGNDVTSTQTVTDSSSTLSSGYFLAGNYNENEYSGNAYDPMLGAYQYVFNSFDTSSNDGVLYMGGGHYSVKNYKTYYGHSGYPIGDGTNYMTVTDRNVASNTRIINTTDIDEALLWTYSNNRLTTQYNGTTYYLSRNSDTNLQLTTSSGSALSFAKETRSGTSGFRYKVSNENKYLARNGSYWGLTSFTPLRTRPTPISEPEVVAQPSEPRMSEPSIWYTATDRPENYYYIYNGDNYMSTSAGNTSKSAYPTAGPNNVVWYLESAGGSDYYIKNLSNSNHLQLTYTSFFAHFNYGLTTKNDNTLNADSKWTWSRNESTGVTTIYTSSEGKYVYYSNGWEAGNNQGNVYAYPVHQAYLDWQAYLANKALWDEYDQYLADKQAYEDYLDDDALWVQEDAADKLTYALAETSYVSNVQGPDTYIGSTTQGMDFSGQDVTYFPLNINHANDENLNYYHPTENNTGYFIGATTYSSLNDKTNLGTTSLRFGAYEHNFHGSYSDATYEENGCSLKGFNHTTGKFDRIYTRNASGTQIQIQNAENNYVKFGESRSKIEAVLAGQEMTQNYSASDVYSPNANYDCVYGMHFMQNEINKNKLVTAKKAQILGKTKTNYEMPASSVDFNLKEKGYINFFAGTYYHTGGNPALKSGAAWGTVDSFFSLYDVFRDGQDKITDIKKISKIYSDGEKSHSYVYRYSDGNWSVPYRIVGSEKFLLDADGGDTNTARYTDGSIQGSQPFSTTYTSLVFDTSWIEEAPQNGAYAQRECYYFEIPMNTGEYCLGSVTNGAVGAYLIYLDIAANAAQVDRTEFTEKFMVKTTLYNTPKGIVVVENARTTMSGLFENSGSVDDFGYAIRQRVQNSVDLDEANSIAINIASGYTGTVSVSRSAEAFTLTRAGPPGGSSPDASKTKLALLKAGSTLTLSGITTDIHVVDEANAISTSTILRTVQYDVNTANEAVTRTVITKVDGNNPTIVQQEYKYVNDAWTWVDVAHIKIYDADGVSIYDESTAADTSAVTITHTTYQNSQDDTGVRLQFFYVLEGDDAFDVINDVVRDLIVQVNASDDHYYDPTGFSYEIKKGNVTYTVTVTQQTNTYNIQVYTGNTKTGITTLVTSFTFAYPINNA